MGSSNLMVQLSLRSVMLNVGNSFLTFHHFFSLVYFATHFLLKFILLEKVCGGEEKENSIECISTGSLLYGKEYQIKIYLLTNNVEDFQFMFLGAFLQK